MCSATDAGPSLLLKPTFEKAATVSFVSSVAKAALSVPSIDGDDDFFAHGLDSIKSMEMVRLLKVGITPNASKKSLDWISLEPIFQSPTVNHLVEVLNDYLNEDRLPDKCSPPAGRDLDAAVAPYVASLPKASAHMKQPNTENLLMPTTYISS